MKRRAFKVFTLVNFALCLGGLIWFACSRGQGAAPTTAAPSNTSTTATAPSLATLDDIVGCLEKEGGLSSDGACIPATGVDGLEAKATLNDHYFAASKAAVPVTVSYRDRVDGFVRSTLASACPGPATAPAAPTQQAPQVAAPPAPPSADQLTCLRTELARRTHAKH